MPNDPTHLCDPSELVRMVQNEDLEALDRMTRCYGDRLLAVGRKYCRSNEEAEDAVQDALESAGHHLGDFRGEGAVEGWLRRMVQTACSRMRRGRKNDPSLHETEAEVASPQSGPEKDTYRLELAEVIGQALLELSPQDRLILLLAEADGWKGPQIAQEVGLSPEAVRARLSRARALLRDVLLPQLVEA